MGGRNKGLLPFAGRPLVEWVIKAITPQVGALLISANCDQSAYGAFGYPVVGDQLPGFEGPLAGCLTAMLAARSDWILTVPCDGPCPPPNLLARLADAWLQADAELAVVHDGARLQPLYALLPAGLAESLRDFLAGGERRVEDWLARHQVVIADFSDQPSGFVNLNTPAELLDLEREFLRSRPA